MSFGQLASIVVGSVITCIDVPQQPDYFACGTLDDSIYVWQAKYNQKFQKEYYRFQGNSIGIIDIAFNRHGNRLIASSMDSCIRVWNIDQGAQIAKIQCQPMQNWKLNFVDDNIVTSGQLGKLSLFSTSSYQKIKTLSTQLGFLTSLAVSPDQKFIATGNKNGQIFIFESNKLDKPVLTYKSHHKLIRGLSFAADSQRIISGGDDLSIICYDLNVNKASVSLSGHSQNINSIDCNPADSKLIASCSMDRTVKYWDLLSKASVGSINFHNGNVWSVKHSYQGKYILSGGQSGILAIHSAR